MNKANKLNIAIDENTIINGQFNLAQIKLIINEDTIITMI